MTSRSVSRRLVPRHGRRRGRSRRRPSRSERRRWGIPPPPARPFRATPPPSSRSTARTRRASSHRPRTGSSSPRSTSSRESRADLVQLLKDWTSASRKMVLGQQIGRDNDDVDAAARRHRRGGRARSVVAHAHVRLRRVAVRPAGRPVRHRGAEAGRAGRRCRASPATRSSPAISDGDLAIQACADDPTVAFHAIRNLARIGRGVVALRWSQHGLRPHVEHRTRSRSRHAT